MTNTIKKMLATLCTFAAIVCAIVGVSVLTSVGAPIQAATAYAEEETNSYIEFTTAVTGNTTRYVDNTSLGSVEVTYKMTHNDGINSILLIPSYNKDVFSIESVSVNEGTALGAATITEGDGVKKILLENVGERYAATDGNDEYFLTVTYQIKAPTAGTYTFGLDTTTAGDNNKSVAYYIEDGQNKGEQTEVAITVENATLTLIAKQQGVITIGSNNTDNAQGDHDIPYDYWYGYNKTAVGVAKVETLPTAQEASAEHAVKYTYNGDADVTYTWYYANYVAGSNSETVVAPGEALGTDVSPVAAGNYVVAISAPATDAYYEAETKYAYVHINTLLVEVTIADKESAYGEALQELTYTANRTPFEGDSFTITLSTTATQGSNAGTYPITGSASDVVGSYVFNFVGGTYTINPIEITATIDNKTSAYGESLVELTYTLSPSINGLSLVLSTNANNAVPGSYEITITNQIGFSVNYVLTNSTVKGTYTITSAAKDTAYFEPYFSGKTVTYNGTTQDLLNVGTITDEWWQYAVEGNQKTNAGTYNNITVTITVKQGYTSYYSLTNDQVVLTITGTINKADVTFSAVNVNVSYGANPVTPSWSVEGTSEEINYTYTIQNNDGAFTPSAETAVGTYNIVLTEGNNPNFNVTYVNGTYTVNKGTPVINVTASNVYYNRALNVSATASVNTLGLTPSVTYYSDSECTTPATPVNAGTYYVKATVAGTDNYNGASAVQSFEIKKVKLEGVTFTYNHGNVTWTAVANDIGKTATEEGVTAAALKDGVTLTYTVFNGETEIDTYNNRSFNAAAATTYKVVVTASDDNYIASESTMAAAYSVEFAKGTPSAGTVDESTIPATQYIFAGQTAVAPTAPTGTGCTFSVWKLDNVTYTFTEAVNGNIVLTAVWNEVTYTITFKYLDTSSTVGTDVFTMTKTLGETVDYSSLGMEPTKTSDNAGISYTFADKWVDTNNNEYTVVDGVIQGYTVAGDMTFVAVFNTNYNSFTITYYFYNQDTNEYVQEGVKDSFVYNSLITYRSLEDRPAVQWFIVDGWYLNDARTQAVPETMPNQDISVYGGYKFDIGAGDVNGNGSVTADDITLYRQWIVGGYTMTVIANGNEWATATADGFNANETYFLARVADINVDLSKDIRDVSITRMALVGGYTWDVVSGEKVTGSEVIRNSKVGAYADMVSELATKERVSLINDITNKSADFVVDTSKNIYIDLCGNTLTVNSLTFNTSGNGASITIKNGTIVTENGITITAPNGNVVIDNVTAYDNGGIVNLQAASSSLHFYNQVAFNAGTQEASAPAQVKVASGTHVVVEQAATVTVEKLVVATVENNVFTKAEENSEATITIKNESAVTEAIEVAGNYVEEESAVPSKIVTKVTTIAELQAANGKSVVLGADIVAGSNDVIYNADTTLDLNDHNITFSGWGFEVRNGATLTINGNGTVSAVEAALYAQYAGNLVINGGTYEASDNAVVGTHGGAGRGNNTITINGGTFNGGIQAAGYLACGIYVANNDTVTVNGGTFNITNGVGILARSGNTTVDEDVVFNVTGNGVTGKVGDSTVNVPSGAVLVVDYAANYPGGDPTLTNNTEYTVYTVVGSVAELNAASGNVVLGANITTDKEVPIVITSNMTLNLNSHTITSTNDVAIRVNGANASLTIEGNGEVIAQEACVMAFDGSAVVINGGTYTAIDNFVVGTNGTVEPGNDKGHNTITINGGTFNGGIVSAGYVACGIYVANSDTVTVNGGTFNITGGVGILARSGNTTVGKNVVFTVTGDGTLGKVGDSKVTVPSGEVLVLDLAAGYPGGVPTLTNNNTNYTVYTVEA